MIPKLSYIANSKEMERMVEKKEEKLPIIKQINQNPQYNIIKHTAHDRIINSG